MALTKTEQALSACRFITTAMPQLRWSQYLQLLTVAENPGITHAELAKRCRCTPAAITRFVDVFGSRGRDGRSANGGRQFVSVTSELDDDRVKSIQITRLGLGFLEQIEEELFNG